MADNAESLIISTRFRVALFAKGLLLLSLAALFAWLTVVSIRRFEYGVISLLFFGVPLAFLVRVSRLAFFDAVQGKAIRETGAIALKSRKAGYSLQRSNGRFVEYVLFNTWQTLEAGASYTVTFGAWSGVLVEAPVKEVK